MEPAIKAGNLKVPSATVFLRAKANLLPRPSHQCKALCGGNKTQIHCMYIYIYMFLADGSGNRTAYGSKLLNVAFVVSPLPLVLAAGSGSRGILQCGAQRQTGAALQFLADHGIQLDGNFGPLQAGRRKHTNPKDSVSEGPEFELILKRRLWKVCRLRHEHHKGEGWGEDQELRPEAQIRPGKWPCKKDPHLHCAIGLWGPGPLKFAATCSPPDNQQNVSEYSCRANLGFGGKCITKEKRTHS